MEHPSLFVLHFIENLLTIIAGGVIFNLSSLSLKKISIFTIMMTLVVYIVRSLFMYYKLPIGVHTLILMLVYSILMKFILETTWKISLATSFTVFLLITASEIVLAPIIMKIFGWSAFDIVSHPVRHISIGIFDTLPFMVLISWGYIIGRLQNLFNAINN